MQGKGTEWTVMLKVDHPNLTGSMVRFKDAELLRESLVVLWGTHHYKHQQYLGMGWSRGQYLWVHRKLQFDLGFWHLQSMGP